MKLILIAGKAQSGKTTLAKVLKEKYLKIGKKVIITEYSKYVKMFAKDILGWDGKEPKPRKFLQDMGDYVRNNYNDIFFVKRMKEDLNIYSNYADVVIISDVRMPKEIIKMKKYNPLKIKVVSDKVNDLTKEEQNHYTEHALDNFKNFDYVINKDEIFKVSDEIIERSN